MKNTFLQASCRILLVLYGTMILFGRDADDWFVICLLLSTAASFGSALPGNAAASTVVSVSCLGVFCFLPSSVYFIPLLLYEPFRRGNVPCTLLPVLTSAICAALHYSGPQELYFLILGCLFSFLTARCTALLLFQSRSINDIKDTAAERRIDLERRNKALREQQDTEIYTATLQERNRIAREIHDNVGHILSRSILMTGALSTINRDENMRQPIASLEEQLNQAMTSIRESVHDLHDDSLDLKQASDLLIRDFTACEVSFDYSVSRGIPKNVKYCFLSILKEALTNVQKHSNATLVEIRMIEHPSLFQLTIRDNGTNVRTDVSDKIRFPGGGIGLINMKERVNALHGTITITSDEGFRIFVSVPKEVSAQ